MLHMNFDFNQTKIQNWVLLHERSNQASELECANESDSPLFLQSDSIDYL